MKKEAKQTKFNLEKFEVARLNNPSLIKGGDDTGDTNDDAANSSRLCANSRNHNPPCQKDTSVVIGN